jgi:methyl-accepting chemotaxis protein
MIEIDIKIGFFQELFAGYIIKNIINKFSKNFKKFEDEYENMQEDYKREIIKLKETEIELNETIEGLEIKNKNLKDKLDNILLKLKDNVNNIEKKNNIGWSLFKRNSIDVFMSDMSNLSKDLNHGKNEIDKVIKDNSDKNEEIKNYKEKNSELSEKCADQSKFIDEYTQFIYDKIYDHDFVSKNYQNIHNAFLTFLESFKENNFIYSICFKNVKKFVNTYESHLNIDNMHHFPSKFQWN